MEILLENYVKTITVELNTALEMVNRLYLPAGAKYLGKLAEGNHFCMKTGYISQAALRHQQQIAKLVALQNVMQGIEEIQQQMNTGEGIGGWLAKGNQAIDSPCVNVMGPSLTLSLLSPEASLATFCFLS